jgi:preprotein translocase subunit YajC
MHGIINRFLVVSSMIPVFVTAVAAQEKPSTPGQTIFSNFLPMMLIMFAVIYFFMIRPEQKKQKQRQDMLKNVKKGDKVLTAGGLYGIVGNVKENSVMVKIAENTIAEFAKSSVSTVISTDGADKGPEKEEKKK